MIDVFKVGITISAEARSAFSTLTQLTAMMQKLSSITGKLRLGVVALGGAFAAAGAEGFRLYVDLAKHGDKLLKIHQQLLTVGVSGAHADAALQYSEEISARTPGTTPSEVYSLFSELRTVLGTYVDAMAALAGAAKTSSYLTASGIPGVSADAMIYIFKALDLFGAGMNQKSGKFDPATFDSNLQALARVDVLSHGQLTPETLLQIAKMGGFTANAADFKAFLASQMASWLELGRTAGAGLAQAEMEFIGGRVTKRTADALIRYHLVSPGAFVDDHGVYELQPGHLKGANVIVHGGLIAWVQKVLVPQLKKMGITSTGAIMAAIAQITGSMRALRVILTAATQVGQQQQARDEAQAKKAINSETPVTALTQHTLSGSITSMHDALEGLWQILGYQATNPVIASINKVTTALRKLEGYLAAHPHIAKMTTDGLGIVATGLTGLGVALMAFSVKGLYTTLKRLGGRGGLLFALAAGIQQIGDAFKVKGAGRGVLDALSGASTGAAAGSVLGPWGMAAGAVIGAGMTVYLENKHVIDQFAERFWNNPAAVTESAALWAAGWTKTGAVDFAHLIVGTAGPWTTLALKGIDKGALDIANSGETWAAHALRGLESGAANIGADIGRAISDAIESILPAWLGGRKVSVKLPPGQTSAPIHVHTTTTIDGRAVAKSVSKHQARALSQPPADAAGFDLRASPLYPGVGYSP